MIDIDQKWRAKNPEKFECCCCCKFQRILWHVFSIFSIINWGMKFEWGKTVWRREWVLSTSLILKWHGRCRCTCTRARTRFGPNIRKSWPKSQACRDHALCMGPDVSNFQPIRLRPIFVHPQIFEKDSFIIAVIMKKDFRNSLCFILWSSNIWFYILQFSQWLNLNIFSRQLAIYTV